jgi:3-oxoacyl-[acyl-carrier-protein] synthase III
LTYITSIEMRLGEPVALDDIGDSSVASRLDMLKEQGLRHGRISGSSPVELATASGAATLARAGVRMPGGLIYATESVTGRRLMDDVSSLVTALEIPEVSAMAVAGNGCANLATALKVARNAISAEGSDDILIVTATVAEADARYQETGDALISDGAASFLLSKAPRSAGFRVLAIAVQSRAEPAPAAESMAGARTTAHAIRACKADLRRQLGPQWTPDHFFTGNYGPSSMTFLGLSAGVSELSEFSFATAADIGHCMAADLLITLDRWKREATRKHGESLLLLASGPRMWSLIALEYVTEISAVAEAQMDSDPVCRMEGYQP